MRRVPGERLRVRPHQQSLPDARGGLLGGEIARSPGQAERGETGRDGAGGDQDHLAALPDGADEGVDERVDPAAVEPAGGRGERRRTDLDHDPSRIGHTLTHSPILRR